MGGSKSKAATESPLSGKSTAADVVAALGGAVEAIKGKTVLVTGANSGLGLATARVLAGQGAHVVLACRSQQNADGAAATIKETVPTASLETMVLDLGDQKQISAAAAKFVADGRPLHVLINNAGIMACPLTYTKDGFEAQFGVDHLGPFALTQALLPALRAGAPSRVVNLSSLANYMFAPPPGILLDDLDAKKHYAEWARYGHAKLANILHASEFQRRYGSENITAVSLHPGVIMGTNLMRHGGTMSLLRMLTYPTALKTFPFEGQKSLEQGIATSVFAALAPVEGSKAAEGVALVLTKGAYYSDCKVETRQVHPRAFDAELAGKLWAASEELVKKANA